MDQTKHGTTTNCSARFRFAGLIVPPFGGFLTTENNQQIRRKPLGQAASGI